MLSLLEAGGQLNKLEESQMDGRTVVTASSGEGFISRYLSGNPALEWLAGTSNLLFDSIMAEFVRVNAYFTNGRLLL